jgi:hypothetical protein
MLSKAGLARALSDIDCAHRDNWAAEENTKKQIKGAVRLIAPLAPSAIIFSRRR